MPDGSWRTNLTREQKMGAVFLLVFGMLTIGLGWLQLHNTLHSPFVIQPLPDTAAVSYTDDKTKLQQIDTDHDGISDYDELYFYKTSPYLPDTDSDGIPDKQEIDRGTDPLCPEGQTCAPASDAIINTTTTIGSPLAGSVASPADVFQSAANTAEPLTSGAKTNITAADFQAAAKDPKALRQLLLQTGQIKEADLKQIDDATLISIAAQIVAGQVATTSSTVPTAANSGGLTQ